MGIATEQAERTMQERADRLVRNEVLLCVSHAISTAYTLTAELESRGGADPRYRSDDFLEVMTQPQYTHTLTFSCDACEVDHEREEDDPETFALADEDDDNVPEEWRTATCPDCGGQAELRDVFAGDADPREALEHWAVSNWLAERLAERGEMVHTDLLGWNVWGRCTSGQSISLDGVIREIVREVYRGE